MLQSCRNEGICKDFIVVICLFFLKNSLEAELTAAAAPAEADAPIRAIKQQL